MGAYYEEEQPVARHGGLSCPTGLWICFFVWLAITVPLMILGWYDDQSRIPPYYTVAIAAISGLDPVTDLHKGQGQWLLSPVFNLTVSVASHSRVYGACVGPHMAVKVSYSYLLLPLASGIVPDFCVGPRESSDPQAAAARFDMLGEPPRPGDSGYVPSTSSPALQRY